jgi:hypothetical protein
VCAFEDRERPLGFNVEGDSEPYTMSDVPSSWFHGFWPQWGLIEK